MPHILNYAKLIQNFRATAMFRYTRLHTHGNSSRAVFERLTLLENQKIVHRYFQCLSKERMLMEFRPSKVLCVTGLEFQRHISVSFGNESPTVCTLRMSPLGDCHGNVLSVVGIYIVHVQRTCVSCPGPLSCVAYHECLWLSCTCIRDRSVIGLLYVHCTYAKPTLRVNFLFPPVC